MRCKHVGGSAALVVLVTLLAGCPHTLPAYDYSKEPDPRKGGAAFKLGPGDQVAITVWRNSDLTTNATVRPDGIITMPLIGDIRAAGRTPSGLRKEISRRLSGFIKDQVVTVTVAVTNVISYRFTVSGNVARPGLFTSSRYVTVQEAVAMAGGPTRFAEPIKTVIVRQGKGGKTRRIPVNYPFVVSGKSPQMNLVLLRGDVVHVP
ncbi:MAG: polysaccharide biosynthesis/export family protein [Deltaproteobacteria bacterium]|nr:polysaccharide biosynthesis/export family protein [Deltaproteobacteria bacterium]